MTLTVLLDLRLKPEARADAPGMLRDILAGTRSFAGCLGVDVLLDSADAGHVILFERWESVEADAAYRAWRVGDGATQLGSLLEAAPTITSFTTASDI
ncbi:antibiotic biosynthesis monooxygenase [Cryobacterium sp. PH29-G1]|uniref:putative quinol monooxygenase n=1 Tax=Cryobacterium sp. PH29-G1 TaxID=3046211 RepID=UPI0024BB190B|nr:antibiotic biosynthesis monooxygenase [Cryobacterium sp. PH29-G1]MDJ0348829.1 antibiotic biosynthesis monooxygenase [Cryobacterium sp. PH29-G1]